MDSIQFRTIDYRVAEIVRTSAFMAKIKGKNDDVINLLRTKYEEDITNLEKTVALCFYYWFLADNSLDLADTSSIFQVTFNVINIAEDTLELRPEYWILWLLKYRIQSYMNFNESELISSLEDFCARQRENEQEPYYLVSELLLSHVYYAKDRIEKAEGILCGVLETYHERIRLLDRFFMGFVLEYRNLVIRSGDNQILALLDEISEKYFQL